ncbi:Multidrug resistance protein 1 [Rhizophlyctis rosea]|nr:Multidrug resistance protein 1 [Rhizophlyctis rosea]
MAATTEPQTQNTPNAVAPPPAAPNESIPLTQIDPSKNEENTPPTSEPHGNGIENGTDKSDRKGSPPPEPADTAPTAKADAELKGRISYYQLYRHADRTAWLLILAGSIAAAAAGVTRPIMTIIFANLVDAFTEKTKNTISSDDFKAVLVQHVLYFVYLGIGTFVTNYFQMLCWDLASTRQTTKIRTLYLHSILRQSRSFFDTHNAGELSSRLTSDIELIGNGTGEKVGLFFQAICTFVSALCIAYWQSWRVSLALSCVFPVMAAFNVYFNKKAREAGIESLKAYGLASNVVEESLSSIRTVYSLRGQTRTSTQFAQRTLRAEKAGIAKAKSQGAGLAGVQSCMYLAYSVAFFYGALLITRGQLTSGRLVGVFFALVIGTFRMSSVAPELAAFSNACSAAFAVFTLIDKVPEIDGPRDGKVVRTLEKVEGRLRFEGVGFRYPSRPSVQVLDGVTFEVSPGQTVALVGSSGSGKSTIVALLERWYEPLSGTVTVDGVELRDLDLRFWRGQIGFVSQEPVLFDLTIEENVALGSPENKPRPTKEQIIEACKLANAHSFIEKLPDGYNTLVGERGALLSGGQKQRVAIARALISNPKILLLDEATSALDSTSERLVQEALERASIGRTTVIVAHRLSTIRNADQIIVMHHGKIAEVGDHRSLVEKDGIYRKLVDMQQLVKKAEETASEEVSETEKSETGPTFPSSPSDNPPPSAKPSLSRKSSIRPPPDLENGANVEDVEPNPSKNFWRRIARIHRPEVLVVFAGCITALLAGGIFPAYAVIYGHILQTFALTDLEEMRREANGWAGGFLVIAVFAAISNFGTFYLFGRSGEHVTTHLRTATFNAMLKQEVGWFDREENRTGVLVSRIATDSARVNLLVSTIFGTMLQLLTNIGGGVIVALIVSWKITVVTMCCIPLLIFAGAMQVASLRGFGVKTKKAYQTAAHIAIQAMQNQGTVQTLCREDTFLQKYNEALEEPLKEAHRQAFVVGLGYAASNGLGFLANALAFWWGGTLFARGEVNVQQMFTVMIATVFGSMAGGRATAFAGDIAKAKHSAFEIFSILDRKPKIDAFAGGKDPKQLPNLALTFKNIWFAYPTRTSQLVLKGLDLVIEPGKTIALVGSSGSGKSTIVSLLERFYDPLYGEILVDGTPLKDIDLQKWRTQVGYVGQEPVLFDLSIRENIAYGAAEPDKVTEEMIIAAAREANVEEFVKRLPQGYDTMVGSRSSAQLSGGQRQRIAIARALLQDPRILLLDEATSALDSQSEHLVQEALDRIMENRTAIVVAHRLSTIQNADKIVVMEQGVMVESGTHAELLAKSGVYAELVGMQNLDP